MSEELSKSYNFTETQETIYRRWLEARALRAEPDAEEQPYVIMMPLPNVTGALHMGHAMDNVMQDLLIRWHRMLGDVALWMPGCDHAGIATQAVVEKRLFELEGKTRHDIGRDALVKRIWAWKDEYEARIIRQQQAMGCSCDWDLHRFTMDAVCTRSVREAFFRLFRDGLIFRGSRLVNWDCHLQTAVSDDEIERKTVNGYFYYITYPVIDPRPGEPTHVTVATTRPETMLGDSAIAVYPDPASALDRAIAAAEEKLAAAASRDRAGLEAERARLRERRETYIGLLETLAAMARDGRRVKLPLLGREIPIILDEWAKPELGSGAVKVTPAHDPNDYEVWKRHRDEIASINLLNPDGTYNNNAGPYAGLDRFVVRERVVADLKAQGLLERMEEHEIELGHSDRSKTPIEPYLSRQWFVRMGDVADGIVMGQGTPGEFRATGLAQAAIDAVSGSWKSYSGRNLTFYPDSERYAGTYTAWLAEKRDWCISRQLWWGHQIPIWHGSISGQTLAEVREIVMADAGADLFAWVADEDGGLRCPDDVEGDGPFALLVCIRGEEGQARYAAELESYGLSRDPDVLDTWFSSALWPFSTLGWPDPATAAVKPGQPNLGGAEGGPSYLEYFYPGSCLVTARDIITLWVARMAIMGLYFHGDVPFTDCFIHANIQDGKGERMSKSKGNGIDPIDVIEEFGADAMRYVLCDMQTGTQDIRLPVQAISPFTGEHIDLATAKHGRSIFTYLDPVAGKEFDVLGTIPDLPKARVTSDRFDIGRAFCTKLWNAARFALMNLGDYEYRPVTLEELQPEDRWILSKLSDAIAAVTDSLYAYNPSAAIAAARDFFWGDFCDWYLELIKPRFRDGATAHTARTVLSLTLDHVLRLMHPFVPFITESLWEKLGAQAPVRGLNKPQERQELAMLAPWPKPHGSWENDAVEAEFARLQSVIRAVRDIRAQYTVPPSKKIAAAIRCDGASAGSLRALAHHIVNLGGLEALEIGPAVERPALAAVQALGDVEIYVAGVLDPEKERARLEKQREKIMADLLKSRAKLQNAAFVDRAPADVVATERQRAADSEAQIAAIEESLRQLS